MKFAYILSTFSVVKISSFVEKHRVSMVEEGAKPNTVTMRTSCKRKCSHFIVICKTFVTNDHVLILTQMAPQA